MTEKASMFTKDTLFPLSLVIVVIGAAVAMTMNYANMTNKIDNLTQNLGLVQSGVHEISVDVEEIKEDSTARVRRDVELEMRVTHIEEEMEKLAREVN